jgi:hypothetical protein|tara:strand:+ start:1091 stop:1285 length:195 start_codon:yes stop_codon:yes gene_type:complete
MRPDKSYRLGAGRLIRMFIGEMQTLGFKTDEIALAVIEECCPEYLESFNELNQQFDHLKETTNA